MKNVNLTKAKANKNDEFYTRLTDIEKELFYYRDYFKDRVIFCNCDDPEESNFYKYFNLNFEFLGLKKLVTTHYNKNNKSYKLEVFYDENGGKHYKRTDLEGDGDFRSDECTQILKQADIVITNPPFSLWREYVAQLMEYNKQFLIIGNFNAISYKEVFSLIKENKIWLGQTGMGIEFKVPDHYELYSSTGKIINGEKFLSVSTACWFTNIPNKRQNEELFLYKKYKGNEEYYPKYDNYDAININKTNEIPCDYEGAMGVPITFLDKHNPEQFEILALGIVGSIDFTCNKDMEILDKFGKPTGKFTKNAKGALYKKFNPKIDDKPAFKDVNTGELFSSIYARIIIKNKKPQGQS